MSLVREASRPNNHLLNSTTTRITHNKIVPDVEMIRLNGLESVDSCRLRLTDHLNLRPASHPRTLSGLESGILGRVTPDGRAGEDKLDTGGAHEGLAVPPSQGVHGVLVDLREVVADGVDDILVEALQLSCGIERANIKRELLGAVQEELDAAEPRLFGLELEAPFRRGLGPRGRAGWIVVSDLRGDLVGGDAIATRPCFDDFNVIWS